MSINGNEGGPLKAMLVKCGSPLEMKKNLVNCLLNHICVYKMKEKRGRNEEGGNQIDVKKNISND